MARFRLRNALQRVLGPTAMGYLLHLRPLEWPIMTAHMLLGTFLAVGRHLPKSTWAAWFIFVVAMNGGTLALNSAFDQDEGDIGYLKQPPKPPKHLAAFGFALLAISLVWSFTFARQSHGGKYFFEIVMTCVLMSVLYSVPPIRLKARAGWDLLINCVGFGFFTPLAGWTFTGNVLEPMIMSLCIGFGLLFAALYPLTQIYQVEEDTRRGDSTLVIRIGVGRSLTYGIIAAVAGHIWFAKACLEAHVSPLPLLISLAAWIGLLLPWRLTWQKWDSRKAEAGMYRGLWAWAITDISILIMLWPRGL
jgi:4-hydroxybenzoate polyprenyltransferase